MTNQYRSSEEVKGNPLYMEALTELLFQLADDDLLISHRGSEWIGLAPHIEEDVAFASITQNTMGHALMYYRLLEELGLGRSDDLAQLRKPEEYRNAIFTERKNGEGHYVENPNYDWAYAVVRNYIYEIFKKIRLDMLTTSSYLPLAEVAAKIKREQFYHLYHWEVWIDQLSQSTDEAKKRLNEATKKIWKDLSTLFDEGPKADQIIQFQLLNNEYKLKDTCIAKIKEKWDLVGLLWPGELLPITISGREGEHTQEFVSALHELSEVYRIHPQASW